jgi:Asp-tRNA(Asn)/Glu-tRNA(Gln) amidotransferase A subunit family amidase
MRPSPGMIGNNARALGWSVISVVGPMGRDVADTALLYSASVGRDAMDPLVFPNDPAKFWPLQQFDLSKLRIGYTEDFGVCIVDQNIRRTFRKRIDALSSLVATCEPIDFKLGDPDRAFDILRAENFVSSFAHIYRTAPETLGANICANMEIASAITLADRAWAHLEQTKVMRQFAAATEKYDLILSPVVPVTAFPWTELYAAQVDGQTMRNYYHWLGLTYVVTLATNPTIALPCGTDEHGMPFGLQMSGRLFADDQVLAAAHAIEQAFKGDTALCRPKPDLKALQVARPELKSIVTHPPIYGSGTALDASAAAV